MDYFRVLTADAAYKWFPHPKNVEFVFDADLQQRAEVVNSFWRHKTNVTAEENTLVRFFFFFSFSPPDLSMRVRSAPI